ncbi:MAG: TrkH family potassium uptake protein [Deferribacterota bacterium]|nr:TrkH family potassium uptake protein [Deferribacterota bacterium]
MHPRLIFKILLKLLFVLSIFMAMPVFVALYYREYMFLNYFLLFSLSMFCLSMILLFILRNVSEEYLTVRDGFLLVFLCWLLMSIVGALPYFLSGSISNFCNAFFESVSGFTTTGASILNNVEDMPKSILFWRSLTHWIGGMGIIVLTVAILPILGVGGLQLVKAELPGPTVDRLTPRIKDTAKLLWAIYVIITFVEVFFLMLGGLNFFDSITHSFSTVATGGFSTKNNSVEGFNSSYIELIITIFMIAAGVNFTIYYRLILFRFEKILLNTEFKAYLLILFTCSIFLFCNLYFSTYHNIFDSLRYAFFQAATIMTTTGFSSFNYEDWPYFSQSILFLLMFIGASSGSTGGGIKVIRIITLLRQAVNEMKFIIHPKGVFAFKINGIAVKKDIVYAISAFCFLYIIIAILFTAIISTAGVDLKTSLTSVLATLGNIGPGLGLVGPTKNYSFYPDYVKWILSFLMILGRLELYTVFILLFPFFWKK